MKPNRIFLVLLSILLAIIILTMIAMVGGAIENRREMDEYNRMTTALVLTNQAFTPDYSNTWPAKPWTATPTKQPQPINF